MRDGRVESGRGTPDGLRVGEGLVGDIAQRARPLNLSDAAAHPRFVYRPETGGKLQIFRWYAGFERRQYDRVLVVQNVTQRSFVDEEVEALQTVAMVLSNVDSER